MNDAWQEYGFRLYRLLLHANFLNESLSAQQDFAADLCAATKGIEARELDRWLNGGAWREMLPAAWIIGLRGNRDCLPKLRALLLASGTIFAGQALCFALARLEDADAGDALTSYLEEDVRVCEREWAIGALVWLDSRLGTQRAEPFLHEAGRRLTATGRVIGQRHPNRGIDTMARVMSFVDDLELLASSGR